MLPYKISLAEREGGFQVVNMLNMVTSSDDLAALLDWYAALGADCALDEAPQNRFEETQRQLQARQQARIHAQRPQGQVAPSNPAGPAIVSPSRSKPSTPLPNSPSRSQQKATASSMPGGGAAFATSGNAGQLEDAAVRAMHAPTLIELRKALAEFDGCSLKFSAKSLVFGDGNPDADVMFIGEAPGRDEDLQGVPFVGRAGQLLDKMMAAIGRDRSNSYITNILPWRPPGNRQPSLDEQAMLRPFIHRHIELVNPKILVFLGGTAAQQLLGSKEGIMRLRGKWNNYAIGSENSTRNIPVMPILHPAFLLRTPAQKRSAWQDLLEVAAKLDAMA